MYTVTYDISNPRKIQRERRALKILSNSRKMQRERVLSINLLNIMDEAFISNVVPQLVCHVKYCET